MREIVLDEIRNTEMMTVLCERDSRLGYHSEAEGYLFYPAKLRARVKLLQELLETDFPKFRMDDPALDSYTGRVCSGISAVICRKGSRPEEKHDMGNGTFWQAC